LQVTQLLENGLAAFPQSSVLWVGTPEVYVDDPQDREEVRTASALARANGGDRNSLCQRTLTSLLES
jgi:hypothetical protein